MKLSKKALGLASGIIIGIMLFLATIFVMIVGGGNTLGLLGKFFFGYSINFGGAILALIYGFVYSFIIGWLFAWAYNLFVKTE